MNRQGITGHMVVKNEDQWVGFAINSVLPFVDTFLITDTGSSDNTVKIIQSIKSNKIKFAQVTVESPSDVTKVRESQIKATQTPWIWLVDGDEIYPRDTAGEVVKAVKEDKYSVIAVKRYDLLGDIYHRQSENVGSYDLYGEKGHLVSRLFNRNQLANLTLKGDYPNENYYYQNDLSTLDIKRSSVYITSGHLYHAMYLKRSSLGASIGSMFNRSKYKIEKGILIMDNPPEVLDKSAIARRSLIYELLAGIITPIKNLKRRITS